MKSIGEIIREHRKEKGYTQEELGKLVFVSKQAVSKWETGRTTPDIEMIRKLSDILEIGYEEIICGSFKEVKKSRKWLKISAVISLFCFLCFLCFLCIGGFDYIENFRQSGITYITVFKNGDLLSCDEYSNQTYMNNSPVPASDLKDGYRIYTDYGEVRGVITLEETEVEYGFINANKWHNVQIKIDIEENKDGITARQVVTYATEEDRLDVSITEDSDIAGKSLSVCCEGI